MENPLVVFVSSMIGEFKEERGTVKEAIEAIPLTRPWVFEYTPASSDILDESYLRWVRECDIFILLLAHKLSSAVRKEWQTALAHAKPRFVFLKDVERTPMAQAFVDQVDVKWAKFSDEEELRQRVREAIIDELVKGYRRYRLKVTDVVSEEEQPHPVSEEELAKLIQDKEVASILSELIRSQKLVSVYIDARSGGVFFGGPAYVGGDVVGRDQIKTTHEVHFHGPVTGPVHAGSGDIHIDTRRSAPDVASLAELFATLKQEVTAQAPPGMKTKALQKVESLEKAVIEDEPDLGMMESVLNWFKKSLPQLAGAVASVIVHPIVGKIVGAAGELVAAEFKRRFGDLGRH